MSKAFKKNLKNDLICSLKLTLMLVEIVALLCKLLECVECSYFFYLKKLITRVHNLSASHTEPHDLDRRQVNMLPSRNLFAIVNDLGFPTTTWSASILGPLLNKCKL